MNIQDVCAREVALVLSIDMEQRANRLANHFPVLASMALASAVDLRHMVFEEDGWTANDVPGVQWGSVIYRNTGEALGRPYTATGADLDGYPRAPVGYGATLGEAQNDLATAEDR